MDIPPEERNLDPDPDFEKEGFLRWMGELSEEQLRKQLRQDYTAKWKRLIRSGLRNELESSRAEQEVNAKMAAWIRSNTRAVVYPAGRQASWLLNHSMLSQVNILGFSDRNPEMHGKSFHGYKVFAPSEIPNLKPDIVIVASDLYQKQIFKDLEYLKNIGVKLVSIDN